MNKINPNGPAYPSNGTMGGATGITIRAEIAARIMATMMASYRVDDSTLKGNAAMACEAADALIAKLSKEPT